MGVLKFRSSISLSLFLHALLFSGWALLFSKQAAKTVTQTPVWIELDPSSKLKKATVTEDSASKRIVQTNPGKLTEKAAPDAYLGEKTQTVDRQTVSRTHQIRQGGSQQAQTRPGASQAERVEQTSRAQPLSKLGVAMLPKEVPSRAPRPADRGASEWMKVDSTLAQDYIKGLSESEVTALNTREYVFYGYFQRIRSRLDRAWEGLLRQHLIRLIKGGRRLASNTDHTTKVIVVLNPSGEIVQVQVLEESGTRDLDQAAVEAFNKAGPFPNPPRGIVDRNNQIRLRWDFVLRS